MIELLIQILTLMGGVSLYLVIATIVGKAIYSRTKNFGEPDRSTSAVFCGALFPITVPIIILVLWVSAIINIPFNSDCEEDEDHSKKSEEFKNDTSSTKTKFKVGDLVTGVKGNPRGYEVFYPGCICRVLKIDGKDINMILVDHIDKAANKKEIGRIDTFNCEDFTLIKSKSTKKVVKKKKG